MPEVIRKGDRQIAPAAGRGKGERHLVAACDAQP